MTDDRPELPTTMTAYPSPQDSPSVQKLVESTRPTLVRILLHFRIPAEDAEDLIQETLLQFLRKRAEVRDPPKWLAGALRNECLLYWRRRSRALYQAVDLGVLDLLADEAIDDQDKVVLLARLTELIGSLKPNCRSVLEMRYRLGYDNQEIAEETGYRPSSVDKIAQRCLAALSRRLIGASLLGRHSNAT